MKRKNAMPWPEPKIKPISGHPRLFLTKNDIEHFNKKVESDEIRETFELFEKYADEDLQAKHGAFTPAFELKLEVRALMYVLGRRDDRHARKTVCLAREYIENVQFPLNVPDVTRYMGNTMIACAIVYDWCYDLFDSDDKSAFIKRFKEIAAMKEIGYPPTNPNLSSIASHGSEFEIFRDLIGVGIAIYDEDKEMYNFGAGRFFAEMIESRKFFNESGNHPMGSAYGYYRYGCELWAVIIYDRMGYKDILGDKMHSVAYKWLYERLPFGQRFKDGDDFEYSKNRHFSYPTNDIRELGMAANFYRDPYLRRQNLKALSIRGYEAEQFWTLLFAEPDAGIKETNDLPLARKTNFPLSGITARTSWQTGLDSPAAMAHMKIQEKFIACHMHLDSGGFQIYYKGNLAVSSGLYQGENCGSGCSHYANYYARTAAHNCVTVTDPNEKMIYSHGSGTDFSNDGGQRRGMTAPFAVSFQKQVVEDNRAEECASYIGPNEYTPEFSYIKGNLSAGYGDKMKEYQRSMVFTDLFDKDYPAAFVVYDRVISADKSFKKRWLIHCVEEPSVTGNTTVIKRTKLGFNGKLVNKTLLPREFEIEKIGGAGREYMVNGENFPAVEYVGAETDSAPWKIELSPKNESEKDFFLNAMYVTDADGKLSELPINMIETEKMIGVLIRDRIVMFSKEQDIIGGEFNFEIKESDFGEVSVMLADIKPGVWKVGKDFYAEVKRGENVLYFRGKAGIYKISPANDKSASKVSYPKTDKALIGDFTVYMGGQFLNQVKPAKLIDGVPYLPAVHFAKTLGAKVSKDGDDVIITNDFGERLNLSGINSLHKMQTADGEVYICFSDFEEFFGISSSYDAVAAVYKAEKTEPEIREFMKSAKIYPPIDFFASSCIGDNLPRYAAETNMQRRWQAEGESQWLMFDIGEEKKFSQMVMSAYSDNFKTMDFDVFVSRDGVNFEKAYEGTAENDIKRFNTGTISARYIKIYCKENGKNTINILIVAK